MNKKVSIVMAILIVVLVGGLMAVLILLMGKRNQAVILEVPSVVQKSHVADATKDAKVNEWEIYQNTAYGYELEYPADWKIGTTFGADPKTFSAPGFTPVDCVDGTVCPSFAIGNVHEIAGGESVEGDVRVNTSDKVIARSEIEISGEKAYFVEYYQTSYGRKDGGTGLVRQEIKLIHKNTVYRFYIDEYNPDINKIKTSADWEYKKVFEHMLETFKFVENNAMDNPQIEKTTEEISYVNKDFKFSVALPTGWEKYQVSVQRDKGDDNHTYIYFMLPTSDKSWSGAYDKNTGKIIPGMVEIFVITAKDLATWNKDIASKECLNNPTPDCPDVNDVLAKDAKYVFTASYGNGMLPVDLQKFVKKGTATEFLEGKFKLL